MTDLRLQELEIDLLIRALQARHGYDFSQYAPASFKRRVQNLLTHYHFDNVSRLIELVLHDEEQITEIIGRLSVPVSEFFRDPATFATLAREVFPTLASYPHINIWQAGCAHGEEVYSLAILLSEAGLYERTRIYATDMSAQALDQAREGIFTSRDLKTYAQNYLDAGGRHTLSDYFHARYGHIKLDDALKRNVMFAQHNLASDAVFCEAHLILCRNVLIYFQPPLQQRVTGLFRDSLVRGGYLCLGSKETLGPYESSRAFALVDRRASLYRLQSHGG